MGVKPVFIFLGVAIVIALVAFAYLGGYHPSTQTQSTTFNQNTGGYGASLPNTTPSNTTAIVPTTTAQSSQSANVGGKSIDFGGISFSQSELDAITITSNPANLSQISQVSLFRSCAGHDFSGYDFNGVTESARSMKHYFAIPSSLVGASHAVQMFAPFNGTIVYDSKVLDYPNGDQVVLKPDSDPAMGVELFHIDLLAGIAVGTHVGSGQLIGYKNASEYSGFDVAYGPLNPSYPCGGRCQTPMENVWDSIFNHMTSGVLAQYAAVGITQDNAIASKEFRDANPCNYPNETSYGSSGVNATEWSDPRNWAIVR
ncbi:MAG: hypothetical protein KGH59_03015 [Candidatus Micrarchaeota archaeon]|nr:hypothetical protein [Candidatus Micrarchaeota archaeon]